MDKERLIINSIAISAIVIFGITAYLFFSPETINPDAITQSKIPSAYVAENIVHETRDASGGGLVAGVCALLLVGYLFWVCYRKFLTDIRTEQAAKENSLYQISIDTGRNEYDLFSKSAEKWSISSLIIEKDFRRYMAEQVLPHYARDFVRKNQPHIDESLKVKSEAEPTTFLDWVIALLVFPGSVMLLLFMSILLV